MRAVLVLLMMVASALLSACTTTRGPDPALAARIEFPKPKGWVVTTPQQWFSNPDWKLSFTDYGVRQMNEKDIWPAHYYSKYPEPADFLNPSVTIFISDEKVATFMAADFYLDGVAYSLKKMFKDVEISAPVRNTIISGLPAAEMTVQSGFYLSSGRKQRSLTRYWAVRVESRFVLIGADWPADEKLATEAEMMRIVETIRIRPATP